jgi:hypothetical protein
MASRGLRILILTFYYPPDLSAGSFRAGALVRALLDAHGQGLQIDVATTAPNRYSTHKVEAPQSERQGAVSIRRFALPRHKSGMFDQALAFSAFASQVAVWSSGKRWDLVVATSSRLMTAVLGASLAGAVRAPLYLDIRDLFPDTAAASPATSRALGDRSRDAGQRRLRGVPPLHARARRPARVSDLLQRHR